MNVKNNIKKVFAIAVSAAFVGATLVGAFAYDLSNYPAPFVQNGVMNGAIVVGANAATTDVLGAIDIAASLQAEAVTPVSTTGSAATTTVSGEAYLIEGTSNQLNAWDTINDVKTSLDNDELPTLLADGTLKDDSANEETDYSQTLTLGDAGLAFDALPRDEDYVANPSLAADSLPELYLDYSSTEAYKLLVDFDSDVDFSAFDDGEQFTVANTPLTIDPDMSSGDDELVFYMADSTQIVGVGETVDIAGKSVQVLGANTNGNGSATIVIDGDTHQVEKGDTVDGLYVNQIFMQTIPTEAAQVEFFVGSKKVTVPLGGSNEAVEVDGQELDGVTATTLNSSDNNATTIDAVKSIEFTINPSDLDVDGDDYLEMGEAVVDPLFETFKLDFNGMSMALDDSAKTKMDFERSGNDLALTFVNEENDEYTITPYSVNSSDDLVFNDDYSFLNGAANLTNVTDGKVIMLNEDHTTKVYEVTRVRHATHATDIEVDLKDLSDGSTKTLKGDGDQIGDADAYIRITGSDDQFDIYDSITGGSHVAMNNTIYVKNEGTLTLRTSITSNETTVNFNESSIDTDESSAISNQTNFNVKVGLTTSDHDIKVSLDSTASFFNVVSGDNDVQYGLTKFGTYTVADVDNYDSLVVYSPFEETDYNVYVGSTSSTSTTTASGAGYAVNPIALGLGVLDTDVTFGAQPMIIVGGPHANTIAADFLGNPSEDEIAATFSAGKALIKYDDANQAMLVAGYDAQDTQGACYVVANHGNYDFSGNELEVVVTDLNNIVVN